ncbi:serine/threonine-protein kinase [Micromonospora sp. NPDC000207]|uniref:serine/threonine-protein kinase n=1 Tax=Micromonospora sp. NPDC000207 TaxID=3154246 RepID=UPI0033238675
MARLPLAHKGMGEVWSAQDLLLDRPVIVKFVDPAHLDLDALRRFRREARLTARLDHPGVPVVYDIGEDKGRPYVVLQKIEGITLTDMVAEQGPLPIGWAASIGAQISAVLLAARRIDLVHRDLKPSNVMLDTSGATKVLDFGLAVIRDDERYSRITQSGQSPGTVGYMAPEQIRSEPADHRTDLYGLGATLFYILTGHAPFGDGATMTTVWRQLEGPAPHPSQLRPEIPAVVDDLVRSLLAIAPRDRLATAAEVYRVLAPLAQDLPPLPGVFTEAAEAVQAYAAIVGRVPPRALAPSTPAGPPPPLDPAQLVAEAEHLEATGKYRAAARQWRHLAHEHAHLHGEDDTTVFDFRVRAARAHLPLGEHDRALRQFTTLLESRIRSHGPEDARAGTLRREIANLHGDQLTSAHDDPFWVAEHPR